MLSAPEGQAEDEEIVNHVEGDVQCHEPLGFPGAETIELNNFRKGLRDADGAGEFYDVHGEGEAKNGNCCHDREGAGGDELDLLMDFASLLQISNRADAFILEALVEEIQSSADGDHSYDRRDDAVEADEIPGGEPDV